MSSTNRNMVREGSDYYVTPVHHVEHFLRNWIASDNLAAHEAKCEGFRIMDPCAGGTMDEARNIIVPMSYPAAIHKCKDLFADDSHLTTFDIRPNSPAAHISNFLELPPPQIVIRM